MLENLALRHQLEVALRGEPRRRIQQRDRILWVCLRRLWPRGWGVTSYSFSRIL
jgi:hypothetical protein